jgi:soluble lytic murein transglycosylase-like protein
VVRDRVRDGIERAGRARGGTGARALLASLPVQLLLGATLVLNGAAVAVGSGTAPLRGAAPSATPVEAPPLLLPVVAVPALPGAAAGESARRPRAEALALAETYRRRGFRVPDALARQIADAAAAHDIDLRIAFGLVATESGFRRTARSPVGATGLAQLMPATARWLEPGTTRRQLEDPETNLRLGFRYLRKMIDHYDGDTHLALLAYNRGPGTVDRVLRRGGDPDNGYPRSVMRAR